MIDINLLPEQYREKRIIIPLPLCQIAWLILVCLIVFWHLNNEKVHALKEEAEAVKKEVSMLLPVAESMKQVIAKNENLIIPKFKFLNSLQEPDIEIDQTMNIISDIIPPGIWLFSLQTTDGDGAFLTLEGYSREDKGVPATAAVGDFVLRLKRRLENVMNSRKPKDDIVLQLDTTTQPKKIGKFEVTQFKVVYKKEKKNAEEKKK